MQYNRLRTSVSFNKFNIVQYCSNRFQELKLDQNFAHLSSVKPNQNFAEEVCREVLPVLSSLTKLILQKKNLLHIRPSAVNT